MPADNFSKEEVRQVIRLAMEQEKEKTRIDNIESDFSIDELIEIGKEVGLNETQIKIAAQEFKVRDVEARNGSTKTHVFEEREFNSKLSENTVWEIIRKQILKDSVKLASNNLKEINYTDTESGEETVVSLIKNSTRYTLRVSQTAGTSNSIVQSLLLGGMAATVAFIIAFFNTNYLLSIITSITVLGISIPLLRNWDSKGKSAKSNRISSIADRLVETIPSNLDNKSDSIEIEVANVYGTSVQTDDSDSIKVNKRQRS